MILKRNLHVILVLASFLTSSPFVFAANDYKDQLMQVSKPAFGGYYLGGSIGINNNDFSFHDTYGHTMDPGEYSPLIEAFAGFGRMVYDRYYYGGELYVNSTFGDASANVTTMDISSTHVKLKTRDSVGLSIIPGILLNEHTLAYGRIGAVETHFESLVSVSLMPRGTLKGRNQPGVELGIGLQTVITEHVDARLEFTHTYYKSFKIQHNTYSIHPLSDRANIGIVYKFG